MTQDKGDQKSEQQAPVSAFSLTIPIIPYTTIEIDKVSMVSEHSVAGFENYHAMRSQKKQRFSWQCSCTQNGECQTPSVFLHLKVQGSDPKLLQFMSEADSATAAQEPGMHGIPFLSQQGESLMRSSNSPCPTSAVPAKPFHIFPLCEYLQCLELLLLLCPMDP